MDVFFLGRMCNFRVYPKIRLEPSETIRYNGGACLRHIRMGGRVVECSGLENRRRATFRGFESHPIRSTLFAKEDSFAICKVSALAARRRGGKRMGPPIK